MLPSAEATYLVQPFRLVAGGGWNSPDMAWTTLQYSKKQVNAAGAALLDIPVMKVLVIRDASSRFSQRIETKIARNRRRLAAIPVAEEAQAGLLTDDQHIVDAFESLVDARAEPITLLLDITCLPKRFFFFMVKLAVTDRRVRTLIATYTQPAPGGYAREHLAEDPEDVRALPTVASEP